MQTFSARKVTQVQKNTGEKSTNKIEQKGRFVPPKLFVSPSTSVTKSGKQHFLTFEDRHKRLKGFQMCSDSVHKSTTVCISCAMSAWLFPSLTFLGQTVSQDRLLIFGYRQCFSFPPLKTHPTYLSRSSVKSLKNILWVIACFLHHVS